VKVIEIFCQVSVKIKVELVTSCRYTGRSYFFDAARAHRPLQCYLRILLRDCDADVCAAVAAAAGVHIPCRSRSVRGRVLPVRDVRRVHRAMAGAVIQLSVGAAHVRSASHHHVDSLHAYLRHHRQEVT